MNLPGLVEKWAFTTNVSLPHRVAPLAVHLRVWRVHEGASVQLLRTPENERNEIEIE